MTEASGRWRRPKPAGRRRRGKSLRSAAAPAGTGSFSRRSEDVSDAAHGLDQGWLIAIDLAAQIADICLQHAGVSSEVVVPDVVEDLAAREHAARVDEQVAKQPVLGVGQVHDVAVAAHLVRLIVELEVGQRELAAVGIAAVPPQDDAY